MLRARCKWRSSCRCTTSKTIRRTPLHGYLVGPFPFRTPATVGSEAEVLAYMDAGLSTDLNALRPRVAPAWLLPAASRFCPAQSPSTTALAQARRTSHEY